MIAYRQISQIVSMTKVIPPPLMENLLPFRVRPEWKQGEKAVMTTPRYCPVCFKEIPPEDCVCPFCKIDIPVWTRSTPYTSRLIHALNNPHSEVRMGSILSLGERGDLEAARALVDCALRWPTDVVQGLEIVRAVGRLPDSPERKDALNRLFFHSSRPVRKASERTLRDLGATLRPKNPEVRQRRL